MRARLPLLDERTRPHALHQILLGDETAVRLDQHDERIDHLRFERYDLARSREQPPLGVQTERTEFDDQTRLPMDDSTVNSLTGRT